MWNLYTQKTETQRQISSAIRKKNTMSKKSKGVFTVNFFLALYHNQTIADLLTLMSWVVLSSNRHLHSVTKVLLTKMCFKAYDVCHITCFGHDLLTISKVYILAVLNS